MEDINFQRISLRTSPSDRLNAYNRHALAPWIEETGYLTPLYLYRRSQENVHFNMARWMTDSVSSHMLSRPTSVVSITLQQVDQLLRIAASCEYSSTSAFKHLAELSRIADAFPALPECEAGYFVRLSESSPKDVDDGNLQPVHAITHALLKLVCSKRAVQALLNLHDAGDGLIDNKVFFFPYHASMDHLSEWRCYIHHNQIVAISQSQFHQPHHSGVTDDALRKIAVLARHLWGQIAPELSFSSCALDIYAEVHRPDFHVKLIEINPYFPHSGCGSLLFHWLDDADILLNTAPSARTIIRLVQAYGADAETSQRETLGLKEKCNIGRADLINDEVSVLKRRGLAWILEPEHHKRFMEMQVPERGGSCTTRKAGLERFKEMGSGSSGTLGQESGGDHPRFRRVQEAYLKQKSVE